MKVTVTGSLGYVGIPLIKELVKKGHVVTVISSNPDKKAAIKALGAVAAIGRMQDVDFLIHSFTGADAVYCMLAPYGNFTDPNNTADVVIARADIVANNYVEAIHKSGVKRVVYLSSIGADRSKGAGLIVVHYHAENILNKLPSDVNISFIRPAGYYKNLLGFVNEVKSQGTISASYAGSDLITWVSNSDIADVIVQELESELAGRKVRYVASDELTCTDTAAILGAAIRKPDLKWKLLNDQQQLNIFKAYGMNDSIARQFVEMNASIHNGDFYEDYNKNKPDFGIISMADFANEFAAIYFR
jgi:uncharacterized protein YbjT (DUF2867 family)